MTAMLAEIGDKVVAALNAASMVLPFTAARSYLPIKALKELADLRVTVVTAEQEVEIRDRSHSLRWDDRIDIGIQQRVAPGDNADVDPLVELTEQIITELAQTTPVFQLTSNKATAVLVTNEPVFDPDHMAELSLFTSVVSVFYRLGS